MFYNDPDSYYYLYLATQKILPADILFDKIVYAYGYTAGMIALFVAWIFCGLLMFSILWKKRHHIVQKLLLIFFSILFMMTPGLFFLNGWAYILDKNIFGLLIFMLLLHYHYNFKPETMIGQCLSLIYLTTVFWISTYLWSGWIFFVAVYLMFNIASVAYQIRAEEKKKEEIKTEEDDEISDKFSIDENKKAGIFSIIISGIIMYIFWYSIRSMIGNANYIAEMTLSIGNLLLLEVIIFIVLFFMEHKNLSNDMISLCVVCFTAFLVFPRMVILIFPLLYIMIFETINAKNYIYILIFMIFIFIMAIPFNNFYDTDIYSDVKNMTNPCINENVNFWNCTIISNWDNGHVLQYYFPDNKVKYKAHPNNVNVMLDLLYYKNRTCKDCVLVYREGDLEKLEYLRR